MPTPANTNVDYVELYLATPYTDGDTTLDLYAKNDTYKLTDQKTSSLITSFRCVGISRDNTDTFMGMAVSGLVTNGTFSGATRYTATLRLSDSSNPMVGLANTDDSTDANANIIAGNKLTSLPADSVVAVMVGAYAFTDLYNSLTSISATNTGEAGETLTTRNSVSLHTDNKVYKYLSTTYANLVGIVDVGVASGATATYTKQGGISTGHSGLTPGAAQYAEDTGAITETASATTKYLGYALSATEIQVNITGPYTSAFIDDAFSVAATGDGTKLLDVLLSGSTTGTTTTLATTSTVDRTITFPDGDITLASITDIGNTLDLFGDGSDGALVAEGQKSITGVTSGGGGKAIFTIVGHNYSDGDLVFIASTSSYNGDQIIENKTTDTFELTGVNWVADETGTSVKKTLIPFATIKNYSSITIPAYGIVTTTGTNGFMILKCTGDVTIAANGKIDLLGKGGAGGAGVSVGPITSPAVATSSGNTGTTANQAYVMGNATTRAGTAGTGGTFSSRAEAIGGTGASSKVVAADTAASTNLAAVVAPIVFDIDLAHFSFLYSYIGSGGASGGVSVNVYGASSTGGTAESFVGGAGGAGLFLFVAGDTTITGNIDVRGAAAPTASTTLSPGPNNESAAAGGGGGGSGGGVLLLHTGTVTGDSNIQVAGGAVSGSASSVNGTGVAEVIVATAGGAGFAIVQKLPV